MAFIFSFYVPGSFFIGRYHLKPQALHILLSFVTGVVLWGVQGVTFGYLQIRWATYIYLVFFLLSAVKRFPVEKKIWQGFWKRLQEMPRWIWIIFGVGTIGQLLPTFGSGLLYANGVEFFSTNAVDGILHIAYIQSIIRSFPPREPGAVNVYIANYHYWSDLVIAELSRVWLIPSSHLFFQFMPLFISLLTAAAVYCVIRLWHGSKITAFWALFLLYFAGDAAYLFMLFLHHIFGFYTPAIDNGVTQFLNMPHAFAKMIFLTSLIPLIFWIQTKKNMWLWLVLLFFSLVGFKIYFAVFAAVGFSLLVFARALDTFLHTPKNRFSTTFQKHWQATLAVLAFAGISAAIYFPVNKTAGGLFYSPLEWPKIFLGKDAIDWQGWWLRHQVYESAHNVRNLLVLDSIAIIICLVSVYGTRLFGFWPNRRVWKIIGWEFFVFFVPATLLFVFLGLYTLQVSGLFNVFNFFAVSIAPLSLLLAFQLEKLQLSKNIFAKIALGVFVILTIPRPIHDASDFIDKYLQNRYETLVPNGEIQALAYISHNTSPNAIVQSHAGNVDDEKAPYVSFFANRPTYLSGVGLLESHNQPIATQKSELKRIFNLDTPQQFATELKNKNIEYVFVQKKDNSQPFKFKIERPYFEVVFENSSAMVLRRMFN